MPDINFDSALNISEAIVIIGGGVSLVWRMSRMASRFEMIGQQQAQEIKALKEETHELRIDIEKLNDVMIELTRAQGRMNLIDERLMAQGKRLDESIGRFSEWSERVYEERHRQLLARVSRIENGGS